MQPNNYPPGYQEPQEISSTETKSRDSCPVCGSVGFLWEVEERIHPDEVERYLNCDLCESNLPEPKN